MESSANKYDKIHASARGRVLGRLGPIYLDLLAETYNMAGVSMTRALLDQLADRSSPQWRDASLQLVVWGEGGPPIAPRPAPADWDDTYLERQDARYEELETLMRNQEVEGGRRRTEEGSRGATGGGEIPFPASETDRRLMQFLEAEEQNEVRQLLERAEAGGGAGDEGLNEAQRKVLMKAAQKVRDKKEKYEEEVLRIEGIKQMIASAIGGGARGGAGAAGGSGGGLAVSNFNHPRARMPMYNSSGEDKSDYRSHVQAVKTYLTLQKVTAEQERIQLFFLSFDSKARYRMSATLDPGLDDIRRLTFAQYVARANELFEPASECELWKSDFRQLTQRRNDSIQDYLQNKSSLYKRAYASRMSSAEHLIEEAVAGIYNSEVRKEVIRVGPKTYEDLLAAALKATGFVRKTGNYARPQDYGLASVSHRESTGTRGGAGGAGEGKSHLGQLEEEEEEEEEEKGDDDSPLTLGEVERCMLNETEIETSYWHEQPMPGGYLEEVEDGSNGSQSTFKYLPPGAGCWSCGSTMHLKARCPKRLEAVKERLGADRKSRNPSSRNAANKKPFGRNPSRNSSYVNSNSRDKRRGIYPVQKLAEDSPNTVSEVGGGAEESMCGTLGGMDQHQDKDFQ